MSICESATTVKPSRGRYKILSDEKRSLLISEIPSIIRDIRSKRHKNEGISRAETVMLELNRQINHLLNLQKESPDTTNTDNIRRLRSAKKRLLKYI